MTATTTPGKAIHNFCVHCVGSTHEVKSCGGDRLLYGGTCQLFAFRRGTGRPSVKIIRKFCLDCMGGHKALIRACGGDSCPLQPYRLGKNPNCIGRGFIAAKKQGSSVHFNVKNKEAEYGPYRTAYS